MVTPPGKDKWLRSSQVVQWVKDPASSLQQLGSLLWLGLSTPSLETIACCGCDPKAKKKKKKKKKKMKKNNNKNTSFTFFQG